MINELFNNSPGSVLSGPDIVIDGGYSGEILVSEYGHVFYYAGILLRGDFPISEGLNVWPYYLRGKHSSDKDVQKQIIGFARIENGCIVLDRYADCYNFKFKRIDDAAVRFPSQAVGYYGVLINREENEQLTRAVFGLTYTELSSLLECCAKIFGWSDFYIQYPRLTRSGQRNNYCDLTGAWIPKTFPYITFAGNEYDFSHVSLWGFYRYIQLLKTCNPALDKMLLNSGADSTTLDRLFSIGNGMIPGEIITAGMISMCRR